MLKVRAEKSLSSAMVTFRAARSPGAGFPHFYPRRHPARLIQWL